MNLASGGSLMKSKFGRKDDARNHRDGDGSRAKNILCRSREANFLPPPEEENASTSESTQHRALKVLPSSYYYTEGTILSADNTTTLDTSNTNAGGENNASRFSLPVIPSTGKAFSASNEDKAGEHDLVFCDLPDFGDFEDFDGLFGTNSDYTFGGGSSSVDELSWFSSSSPLNFDSEANFPPGLQCTTLDFAALNDAAAQFNPVGCFLPENNSAITVSGSDANDKAKNIIQEQFHRSSRSEIKSTLTEVSKENGSTQYQDDMIRMHKQLKRHLSSPGKEGRQASKYKTDGSCSLSQTGQFVDSDNLSCHPHSQLLEPSHFWLPDDASVNLLAFNTPKQSEGVIPTTLSSIICESDNSFSTSRGPDCFTSHYDQLCLENAPELFSKPPDMILQEMTERHAGPLMHSVMVTNTTSVSGHHTFPKDIILESEIEDVVSELPAIAMDSSTLSENSCMASFGGMSVNSVNFLQLRGVTDQLDVKTKLCIKDSLYRLAKSAEQRHNFASTTNGSIQYSRGVQEFEVPKRCVGHISMETETNPIDRSIAHLLFHRPADSMAGLFVMPCHSNAIR